MSTHKSPITKERRSRSGKPDEAGPPEYLWRSGKLVAWDQATVHVSEIGWSAISSVFEGVRAYWNAETAELQIFRLDAHLKRLFQSLKIMRMSSPHTAEELTEAVASLLRANVYRCDAYIQLIAYFGGGVPGYMAVLEEPGEVVITARPAPSGMGKSTAVSCNVSSWTRISDNVMPPRVKAIANYQNSRYVSTESRINGYDHGIILNPQGKVAEASYACVFVIRDGVAITPPSGAGILESITRDVVTTLLEREIEMRVVERDLDRTELYIADEAFLCGTAMEVKAIGSVDRYGVGTGEEGPVVASLRTLLHGIVRGADQRYADWRTPVQIIPPGRPPSRRSIAGADRPL